MKNEYYWEDFIKVLRWIFKKIVRIIRYISNMKIMPKIILGYILVVIIPVVIQGAVFIMGVHEENIKELEKQKESILNQSWSNFNINRASIANTYDIMNNKSLIRYVDNYYINVSEYVYRYLEDIVPLFQYAISSNKYIDDIKVYRFHGGMIDSKQYIEDFDSKEERLVNVFEYLEKTEELWSLKLDNNKKANITFYTKMYNNNHSKVIGLLEVQVNNSILLDNFKTISHKSDVYISMNSDYFRINNDTIEEVKKSTVMMIDDIKNRNIKTSDRYKGYYIKNIVDTNIDFLVTAKYEILKIKDILSFLFYRILLLLLLSGIYYFTIFIIISRINNIIKHIETMDYNNLSKIELANMKNDEIGLLASSFNNLIDKINKLVVTTYNAEIDKKEADYYALQAQIKPHFIYNTLENIRMISEINGDEMVGDMIHELGCFIRYNIEYDNNYTLIEEEVNNIKNYLEIYKIRLGDNLSYTIDMNTDIADCICPRFILQPIIENCMQHGFDNSIKRDIITIDIGMEDEYLIITISDNGIGIDETRLKFIQAKLDRTFNKASRNKNESIGLLNVNRRIKYFFDSSCGIELTNTTEGCSCRVKMYKQYADTPLSSLPYVKK